MYEQEYGVTATGCVIKRLDVLLDEIHSDLTEAWGFNTRQNPQSFINVLTTNFADKLAQLWEFGQDVYNATYPFSAEGVSLDNAVQLGGIQRNDARPTIYPVHTECVDGTVLPEGTLIKTITNPEIELQLKANTAVSRDLFNSAKIIISALQANTAYIVIIDGIAYSVTSSATPIDNDILTALSMQINGENLRLLIQGKCLKYLQLTYQASTV
jgi:uncharacterized phage protein gp47/JayE